MKKITRAIRSCRLVRTCQSPLPSASHKGIPRGHPISTDRISVPILMRSSTDRSSFNHLRTGSFPASVQKNIAGKRFGVGGCCTKDGTSALGIKRPVGDKIPPWLGFFALLGVPNELAPDDLRAS